MDFQPKRKETFIGRYLEGLKNQNAKHLVNLCKSNNLEAQFIFPIVKLATQIFTPFLSKAQLT